jgi:hypothetical protein
MFGLGKKQQLAPEQYNALTKNVKFKLLLQKAKPL